MTLNNKFDFRKFNLYVHIIGIKPLDVPARSHCVHWRDEGYARSLRSRRNDAHHRVSQKGKTDGRR